jgi:hypothetical protein
MNEKKTDKKRIISLKKFGGGVGYGLRRPENKT